MAVSTFAFAFPLLASLFPAVPLLLRLAGTRLRTPFLAVVDGRGGLNGALRVGSEIVPVGAIELAVDIGGRELKYSRDLVGMALFGLFRWLL